MGKRVRLWRTQIETRSIGYALIIFNHLRIDRTLQKHASWCGLFLSCCSFQDHRRHQSSLILAPSRGPQYRILLCTIYFIRSCCSEGQDRLSCIFRYIRTRWMPEVRLCRRRLRFMTITTLNPKDHHSGTARISG